MNVRLIEGNANFYKEGEKINIVAFGNIRENGEAKAKVLIEGVDSSTLQATCGCTATVSEEKNVYTIQYKDTNILRPFSKVLILNYEKDGVKGNANIKITGNVIK